MGVERDPAVEDLSGEEQVVTTVAAVDPAASIPEGREGGG